MPRPPVEIDDEDRSAEGLGAAQHPNPRVVAEIIEDQAALPLFAIFGDHGGTIGRDRRRQSGSTPDPPSGVRR